MSSLPSCSSTRTSSAVFVSEEAECSNEQSPLLHSSPARQLEDNRTSYLVNEPCPPRTSNKTVARVVVVLLAGVLISSADVSIMFATHALIASEFKDLSSSSWLFVSFGLAQCAAQPQVGKLSDLYGRKAVLLSGYALFAIGCFVIGVAQSLPVVIVGRVISGIGSAGMVALVSIILTDLVALRDVASWRSFVNVVATTGRSLGGPVGGWFADTIGWRWTFFGQVPIMVVASVLVSFLVPQSTPRPLQLPSSPHESTSTKLAELDILGSILISSTILLLMLPLELGGQTLPWSHPAIFSLFGAALLAGLLFAKVERRAAEPVLPLQLFRNRDVVLSFAATLLQVAAQTGVMFTVPLYFQITTSVSMTEAGAHLVPAVVGNAVGGLLSGALIRRTGRYKGLVILGALCPTFGYLLMLLRWSGPINFWESLYIAPGGFGTGVLSSAAFVSATAAVDPALVAVTSSSIYLAGGIGAVTGMAASSAALQTLLNRRLWEGIAGSDIPDKADFIRQCMENIKFVQGLDGRLKYVVTQAYLTGFKGAYVASIAFALSGTILGLFMKEHSLS